ncbi:protein of unknown function [Methylotuvimicrobium alcaliphilum 20Z]|uniref:Uncharacterized protein n=1 Tax=Methylotuvimicrobium alcaliphilum (strain DSM 19304 / NCIMB 14124 / VKM B-2133 / 20Z) TaxID=1091494 RepID=G4T2R3_META2|nr:protein of unknown function [Methylotuvimicrobium alcaliphilum 20Z]
MMRIGCKSRPVKGLVVVLELNTNTLQYPRKARKQASSTIVVLRRTRQNLVLLASIVIVKATRILG